MQEVAKMVMQGWLLCIGFVCLANVLQCALVRLGGKVMDVKYVQDVV